jgi:hypothetical protein
MKKVFIIAFIAICVFILLTNNIDESEPDNLGIFYDDSNLINTELDEIVLYNNGPNLEKFKFKKCAHQKLKKNNTKTLVVKTSEEEGSLFLIHTFYSRFFETYGDGKGNIASNINILEIDQKKYKDLKLIELTLKKEDALVIPNNCFVFCESNDFVFTQL